jgi:hypothetical protein
MCFILNEIHMTKFHSQSGIVFVFKIIIFLMKLLTSYGKCDLNIVSLGHYKLSRENVLLLHTDWHINLLYDSSHPFHILKCKFLNK